MRELTIEMETMTVTIRDPARERALWGHGLTSPVTSEVVIAAHCRTCGERRGKPRGARRCDDGAYFRVDEWSNPCGHIDYYEAVAQEAAEFLRLRQDVYLRGLKPRDVIPVRVVTQLKVVTGRVIVTKVHLEARSIDFINAAVPEDRGTLEVRHLILPKLETQRARVLAGGTR
ncbi:hypothetical protein E1091_05725 [Micromonospora fluostatini]|uniref:Uncharacterized protein n=1 Tax=Micromonospora fluostatini TaxID=1629071 RepID=A0ABY2DJ69_9ACTN|nr:hypothetical protein E1091_05725 [Micromonospora fluostatini]